MPQICEVAKKSKTFKILVFFTGNIMKPSEKLNTPFLHKFWSKQVASYYRYISSEQLST